MGRHWLGAEGRRVKNGKVKNERSQMRPWVALCGPIMEGQVYLFHAEGQFIWG